MWSTDNWSNQIIDKIGTSKHLFEPNKISRNALKLKIHWSHSQTPWDIFKFHSIFLAVVCFLCNKSEHHSWQYSVFLVCSDIILHHSWISELDKQTLAFFNFLFYYVLKLHVVSTVTIPDLWNFIHLNFRNSVLDSWLPDILLFAHLR